MGESRGCISFFATNRPSVAFGIYSTPYPSISNEVDELQMCDKSPNYNYNGHHIPPAALKAMLNRPKLAAHGTATDVDSGSLTGLLFVSERTDSLETLHIALRFSNKPAPDDVVVLNFAEVYDTFNGVRLEDSGCFAGDEYVVYVSTKDDPKAFHQPWTAVYKTHLVTGETTRLTPIGTADLNPSVSPDGKMIAVATFEGNQGGWCGEIEDLQTNIVVFDISNHQQRTMIVRDGGWPTWGSNNHIFFHRNTEKVENVKNWGVYYVDINDGETSVIRVTPPEINAITPAAIDEKTVVVATIREGSAFGVQRNGFQYRHIEVFELTASGLQQPTHFVTRNVRELADHFNPFVVKDVSGRTRIGYHRCKLTDDINEYEVVETSFDKTKSLVADVGLCRVSGMFPTISPDGSKLAFVDNESTTVWIADSHGSRAIYETTHQNRMFSPVWNQNREKDILYICVGPSFNAHQTVDIYAIPNVAGGVQRRTCLTDHGYNNAFPSTNPEGTKLVFRSNRDGNKNLYIMDATHGEYGDGPIERITNGAWTDTHCQWSPRGDWIAFSSNRANPTAVRPLDLPDAGYFGVYLVNVTNQSYPWVKVIDSGLDYTGTNLFAGHVNHPLFSPDGQSLVVAADLAAISCDPVSLPLFTHSTRPYGDIFTVDLDVTDITKNEDLKKFTRFTHSKYENSTANWTMFSNEDSIAVWNSFLGLSPRRPFIDNIYLSQRCSRSD